MRVSVYYLDFHFWDKKSNLFGIEDPSAPAKAEPMEVEGDEDEDYSAVMNDPTFLQSVLESLPGVDPQSEAVRQAVGSLKEKKKEEKPEDKQKK